MVHNLSADTRIVSEFLLLSDNSIPLAPVFVCVCFYLLPYNVFLVVVSGMSDEIILNTVNIILYVKSLKFVSLY